MGRIPFGEKVLVFDRPDAFVAGCLVVGNVDDERFDLAARQGFTHDRRDLGVVDHHLGFTVIEDEGDRVGVEADVDRIDDRSCGRDAEQAFVEGRDVGRDDGHGVALADTAALERGGEATATAEGFGPGVATLTVDYGEPLGVDRGGALEPAQGRERHVVRGDLVEVLFVRVGGAVVHGGRISPGWRW